MADEQLRVAVVVSAPFDENSYIAHLADRNDCIVVDPGTDPDGICAYIDQHKLTPAAILITHGHGDHIAGNQAMKDRWPDCPLVIGRGDAPKLANAQLNLSSAIGIPVISPPANILLDGGQTYDIAGFSFEVQEIPGHSSGHIVFIWRAHQPPVVFGGDILFAGSVGRADFPGGSFPTLAAGIHRHLFTLPDETVVLSGHGPATTIGREKESNPFVGRPAGWQE